MNRDIPQQVKDAANEYLDQIKMENTETFECIVIKIGTINQISYNEPDYLNKLFNLDLFESFKMNADTFIESVNNYLDIPKYSNIKNIYVKQEYFGEEPNYVYEMMYVDLENNINDFPNENEMANLLNINGEKIYSNVIIFKNYLPSLSDSMTLVTITKNDLQRILYSRVNTKIITCDDDALNELVLAGDITVFADKFFEGEYYLKKEFVFLMHNINIWYILNIYDDNKLCGKLIDKPIDKCIIFTMNTDEVRGNLSLDEIKKIIFLSEKLDDYKTPVEFYDEKTDTLGRKIINNKYKVLDFIYNKNK